MKNYHVSIESDIKVYDQDFWEEQKDKQLRRKASSKKAFTGKYGYKFFKNAKGYKANMDDVEAWIDSIQAKQNKFIINLRK